jgi:hypothetical protein
MKRETRAQSAPPRTKSVIVTFPTYQDVLVVKQHMPWDGLNGGELDAGGFGRGKRTKKHDRKEHTIYPGSGLS